MVIVVGLMPVATRCPVPYVSRARPKSKHIVRRCYRVVAKSCHRDSRDGFGRQLHNSHHVWIRQDDLKISISTGDGIGKRVSDRVAMLNTGVAGGVFGRIQQATECHFVTFQNLRAHCRGAWPGESNVPERMQNLSGWLKLFAASATQGESPHHSGTVPSLVPPPLPAPVAMA